MTPIKMSAVVEFSLLKAMGAEKTCISVFTPSFFGYNMSNSEI